MQCNNYTLGSLLSVSQRLLTSRVNDIFKNNNYSLTHQQWRILAMLYEKDGMKQQDIVSFFQKDRAAITRQLDILEKNNYVLRVVSELDNRSKNVHLTQKGKEIVPQLTKLARGLLTQIEEELGAADTEELKAGLQKLITIMSKGDNEK
jgi:DNA-binding MarR family transcriptional regulator